MMPILLIVKSIIDDSMTDGSNQSVLNHKYIYSSTYTMLFMLICCRIRQGFMPISPLNSTIQSINYYCIHITINSKTVQYIIVSEFISLTVLSIKLYPMCITFFCLKPATKLTDIQLLIAFNRDQQSQREAVPFSCFSEDSNLYAGRDIKSGGTWLGYNKLTGVFAFLTNYDLQVPRHGKSRGQTIQRILSSDFISSIDQQGGIEKAILYEMSIILKQPQSYPAFNLVVCHPQTQIMYYLCTQSTKQPIRLQTGVSYGLCNNQLWNKWPKTQLGLALFDKLLSHIQEASEQQIFSELSVIMKNRQQFSKKVEDESSIFIEPFYSQAQKAERMTKSTFYGIFSSSKHMVLNAREVTYRESNQEEIVNLEI